MKTYSLVTVAMATAREASELWNLHVERPDYGALESLKVVCNYRATLVLGIESQKQNEIYYRLVVRELERMVEKGLTIDTTAVYEVMTEWDDKADPDRRAIPGEEIIAWTYEQCKQLAKPVSTEYDSFEIDTIALLITETIGGADRNTPWQAFRAISITKDFLSSCLRNDRGIGVWAMRHALDLLAERLGIC